MTPQELQVMREIGLLQAAAVLAGCDAIADAIRGVPVDEQVKDAVNRRSNLALWEVLKIYYVGLVSTVDGEAFPDPKLLQAVAGGELAKVLDLLKGLPGVGQVATLAELLKLLQDKAQSSPPIPNPG
jgi:hypothetical protein